MTDMSIIPPDVAEVVPVHTLTEEIFAHVKRSELLDSLRTRDGLERRDLRGEPPVPEIVAEMERQLTRGVDYAWAEPKGGRPSWPIRSGVRLESLAFSPWLKDISYTYITPTTKSQFVAHYERWLGRGVAKFLRSVFGFDLETLFDQLTNIIGDLGAENAAYLLLLSRHFRAAAKECNQLSEPCEEIPCSVLDALMVLAELQRMGDLTAELCVAGTTVTKIRRQLRENKTGLKRHKAPPIIGRILDYIPVWQSRVELSMELKDHDISHLLVDEELLDLAFRSRENNRVSIIVPEEPLSFYGLELARVPFAGVRRLSEAFDMQFSIAPAEADIARLAFSILEANAPKKGQDIRNRIAKKKLSPDDVQYYLDTEPDALRQTQRDADSASFSHIPPWYEQGGSINFCHHFWYKRYFDAPFWTCFAERSFKNLSLSRKDTATMNKQMRRLELLMTNKTKPTDCEKIQAIEAVADYACSLGALAVDPAWSDRMVSMADFEARKKLSNRQNIILRERLKLLEQFIVKMRGKRYPRTSKSILVNRNGSTTFPAGINSKLKARIIALQSRA